MAEAFTIDLSPENWAEAVAASQAWLDAIINSLETIK